MIQKYIISLPPITKKNSQQILTNHRTGKPFIAPSRQYKKYEQAAMWYLTPKPKAPLSGRYRVATVFYMPTRRKVDLTNLMEAAHDTLSPPKSLQTTITPSLPAWTAPALCTTKRTHAPKFLLKNWKCNP